MLCSEAVQELHAVGCFQDLIFVLDTATSDPKVISGGGQVADHTNTESVLSGFNQYCPQKSWFLAFVQDVWKARNPMLTKI